MTGMLARFPVAGCWQAPGSSNPPSSAFRDNPRIVLTRFGGFLVSGGSAPSGALCCPPVGGHGYASGMVGTPFPLARVVVISLPGSARRSGFLSQPLGEMFEVSEAFHGASQDWTPYFDAERFAELYEREPVPAEIGCAISHARVIREFAAEDGADSDLLLVAEDDARFTADFPAVLRLLVRSALPHDVVVLADGRSGSENPLVRRKFKSLLQLSLLSRVVLAHRRLYRIGRFAGEGDCAGLYLVTRRGARKFERYAASLPGGKLNRVADAWSAFFEAGGMDIALTRPSLVTWEDPRPCAPGGSRHDVTGGVGAERSRPSCRARRGALQAAGGKACGAGHGGGRAVPPRGCVSRVSSARGERRRSLAGLRRSRSPSFRGSRRRRVVRSACCYLCRGVKDVLHFQVVPLAVATTSTHTVRPGVAPAMG